MVSRYLISALAGALFAVTSGALCADGTQAPNRPDVTAKPGPLPDINAIAVHSQFGGQIFGFDIDQDDDEGLLSEALDLDDGTVLATVETFNQRNGRITSIVQQTRTEDDFLTLGVLSHHVGLVEFEHQVSFLHVVRTFPVLVPLSTHFFNSRWTPPIDSDHLVEGVSRNRDAAPVAVYAYDNSENFQPLVFSTNVSDNTFGPLITLTDPSFRTGLVPKLAYNDRKNKALLGIQTLDAPFIAPTFALVDLADGDTRIFTGVGAGDVDGLAIDSATNIACSTTETDFSVEFYDLDTQTGFSETLPNATNQFYSGADVASDPIHHLFLVAQPNSSTDPGTSSIYVYDESGTLVESLGGFQFSNLGNVVRMHIALRPSLRYGYVDGPDSEVRDIHAFSY